MKKTLAAMAVLGAFSSLVLADSNVTLYGDIDESVVVAKPDKGGTVASINSGFTTGSSRWGIRGTEDLGGGNKVGFILEQGYDISTGAAMNSERAFHRESALIVEGGWGKVTVGRLGTLGYVQSTGIMRGTVFGPTYMASGWGSYGDLHFDRVNNAINYKSPSFGGVTLHLMYANRMTGDDTAKFSENSHYYGIGALYTSADINAVLLYEGTDNKENPDLSGHYHLTLGGSWNLGVITPYAAYQYQWGNWRQHAAQIGVSSPVAGGTAMLGFKYITRNGDDYTFKGSGYTSSTLWNVGAAYSYPISKRTKVYGYAGYTDSSKGWGKIDSYKGQYWFNGWSAAVGMVHSF